MHDRRFSTRSLRALNGVDPRLIAVATRALLTGPLDFVVTQGLRTREQQAELVRTGASRTMNSRHITGHAIDLAPYVDGQVRWDWPLFHSLAAAMLESAQALKVPLEWGGNWQSFPDGPHFQIPVGQEL